MAFEYHSENGNTLTKSQEDLLEAIENLPFPFQGLTKLKDLRTKTKVDVYVSDRTDWLESWEDYMEQYKKRHFLFYGGEHFKAGHRHQGEIGYRRDFAEVQIRREKEPKEEFQPLLGLYNRHYRWWIGVFRPRVYLIADRIRDYAHRMNLNEDYVFGFVFVQEMMHAYFDAFNSKGYPSIEPLEESFSEFGMLAFIEKSPFIQGMLRDARVYVTSKIGKEPRGFGFGIELFERAENDAGWMINRYKDISNWTDPFDLRFKYNNAYYSNMSKYDIDSSEENASKVYEDIVGILKIDWKKPFDPIQPAIGEAWAFDN